MFDQRTQSLLTFHGHWTDLLRLRCTGSAGPLCAQLEPYGWKLKRASRIGPKCRELLFTRTWREPHAAR